VARQGTLDTFALPDVLRLLASTRKTGRLLVQGDRGDGNVWVDTGAVVGSSATGLRADAAAGQVLFELLRYGTGSFTFEADAACPEPHAPGDVEPLLVDAEALMAEWREIAAVVPSLDAWVTLAPTLPRSEVLVDQSSWRAIVSVGAGQDVRSIGTALGLDEVEVSRMLRDLVQTGLAVVDASAPAPVVSMVPPPVEAAPPPPAAPLAVDPFATGEGRSTLIDLDAAVESNGNGAAPVEAHAEYDSASGKDFAISIPGVESVLPPPPPPPPAVDDVPAPMDPGPVFTDEPAEADEVARQLASLSPKAARAVAAAAKAETPEEREAALAEVTGDDDEPINRGLLLKFLSSVRS
jgi:hypothetical protein